MDSEVDFVPFTMPLSLPSLCLIWI